MEQQTKIKFCGITNYDDARFALDLGVDALGFNFYAPSPRSVLPNDAQAIVRRLPASCMKVGVFANHSRSEVEHIARQVGLDTLQFHGDESDGFLAGWKEWRVIRAIKPTGLDAVEVAEKLLGSVDYLLIDKADPQLLGGTGKQVQEPILEQFLVRGLLSRCFLAGGLTPENVAEKAQRYKPFAVDVASGIEVSPGKKSAEKMTAFVNSLRSSQKRGMD